MESDELLEVKAMLYGLLDRVYALHCEIKDITGRSDQEEWLDAYHSMRIRFLDMHQRKIEPEPLAPDQRLELQGGAENVIPLLPDDRI